MLWKGQLFCVRLTVWVLNVFLRICCPVIPAQDSAIRFLWRRSKKNISGGCWLPQSRFKRSQIYLVWTYQSKKPILAMPVIQETAIPIVKSTVITEESEITPGSLNMAAPKMMGVDSKNENLAAPSLVSPISSPVVIVIPERETPGMVAGAWEIPMNILVPQ